MDAFIQTLNRLVNDPAVQIVPDYHDTRPAPAPSSIHSEMFAALERAQQKVYPGAITLPLMVTGATDSAQLRAKGVNAYGIEPAGTDEDLKRMHGNDERMGVRALGQFVEFEYSAAVEVAGTK